MGAPAIWYYPVDGGAVHMVDLGYAMSSLKPVDGYENPTTTNGIGVPSFNPLMGRLRVHLRYERASIYTTSGATIGREFVALENFLRRGGIIGVALDRTKAFAGYVTTGLYAGGSALAGGANVYRDVLTASGVSLSMASGDTVCLESGNPNWKREQLKLSSASVASLSFSFGTSSAILYDRDAASGVMVRHRDFYPALYLPQDQQDKEMVTDESGVLWTLDVDLEVACGIFAQTAPENLILESGATASDGNLIGTEPGGTMASLQWASSGPPRHWSGSPSGRH